MIWRSGASASLCLMPGLGGKEGEREAGREEGGKRAPRVMERTKRLDVK